MSARLATLLRRFQLPPEATAADLRHAYFRDAKRLHPDRNPSDLGRATREFTQLRAEFDEALKLLEQSHTPSSASSTYGYGSAQEGFRYQQSYGQSHGFPHEEAEDGKRWSAASWAARSQAPSPPRGYKWRWKGQDDPLGSMHQSAVPVVGLPQAAVYTASAMFASAIFLWLVSKLLKQEEPAQNHLGPAWLREAAQDVGVQQSLSGASTQGSHSHGGLRKALEGMGKDEMPTLPKDQFGRPVRESSLASSARQAAASGKVWWLERCGSSPACRAVLDAGDERDDSPLHHCARSGQEDTCCALLRLGADPARRNRWGLVPEHLASQTGHSDLAGLLRGVRRGGVDPTSAAALRKARRHPDGLGILAEEPLEDGSFFGFEPSESLRHSANMAIGQHVLGPKDLSLAGAVLERESIVSSGSEKDVPTSNTTPLNSQLALCKDPLVHAAVARLRQALSSAGFGVDRVDLIQSQSVEAWWMSEGPGVVGYVFYEPPGHVSADAPGHWVAIRPAHGTTIEKARMTGMLFYRLDPVRGPFTLSRADAIEVGARYEIWRISEQGASLRAS